MGNLAIIGLVAAAVVILVFVIWAARGWRKRRVERLRRAASMLGLTYEGSSRSFAIPGARQFKLLRRGGIVDELMRGIVRGRTVAVFRYIVVVHYGHGASASLWRVAAFQAGGSLPTFQMRSQSWLTRLRHRLRPRDVVFETHPEVTQRIYVIGPDENAIRNFFDGQVLSQLTALSTDKFTVEANCGWLLVYKHTRRADLKPESIPGFFEQADRLARVFLDRDQAHSFSRVASGVPGSVR